MGKLSGIGLQPALYDTRIDAPANHAPIGGLQVVARSGWFAARPSGTENIYKICAESFTSESHLHAILWEAQEMVNRAMGSTDER